LPTIIKRYVAAERAPAVKVLADAFMTNPTHVAAFGPEGLVQNQLFFRIGLEHMFTSTAFVAVVDDELLGYAHFAPSPSCLPPVDQLQGAAETFLKPLGDAVPRLVEWFSTWSRLDPGEPHVHLGPIGVSPEVQGRGVGTALMNCYIDHLEREAAAGYLETNKPENVEFYRKFGFVVRHEEKVIGTPNWFMWRPRAE
jgi:GNAT superfamily N-acetyltransferase